MRYGVLGPVEVRDAGGAALDAGGPRLRGLLAMLALSAGDIVGVDRLIDGLYGDSAPAGAANALQSQVSRLRRRLDAPIEFHGAGYRLATDPEHVDACAFERLAADGRRALDAGDAVRAAATLDDALALWRGPALADVGEPFAPAQAARLEELRLAASEDGAEAALALGRHAQVAGELRGLVAAHPLRERLRVLLVRALYASGRRAEALLAFEDARRALAEELGADPSPELAAVHVAVLRSEGPGVAGRAPLPAQLTSFVGREVELASVGALLATSRLVTLTGAGGAGKTRLAIEAAGRVPGETCFVDLAPAHGEHVAASLLGALGGRDAGLLAPAMGASPEPEDRLEAALAGRDVLLVLDGCEHVVDAVARLARRLLAACPDLRVLATSREALGITGEALCPVPPLEGPLAVRLFEERAAAVRPGVVVEAGDARLVERVCAALDGLPLAIELAAARLRSLTVEDVAARLGDRFALLSRGDRAGPPRHRTLRAVVEWSWDLLDAPERDLAGRLAVFAGGAGLDAVEHVGGGPAAADALAGLVDKSLVQAGGGRYRMLDTIRAFCAERLAESGEGEAARAAHAAWFLALAGDAGPHLRRAEQVEWLSRLGADQENLHAALRWAAAHDAALGLRLVAALSSFWLLRGSWAEAAAPATALLGGLASGPPPGLDEEYVLCVAAALMGGVAGEALGPHVARAAAVRAGMDRPLRHPPLFVVWALATGPEMVGESLREAQLGTDPWLRAVARLGAGHLRVFEGDVDGAGAAFEAALSGFRELGERWGIANALDALAGLADWRGDAAGAIALCGEAAVAIGAIGSGEDVADVLRRRAAALLRTGDAGAALADYERAADLARRAGAPAKMAAAHRGMAEVARLAGDAAAARRLYEAALEECGVHWYARVEAARALVGLGRIAEDPGVGGRDVDDPPALPHQRQRALDDEVRRAHVDREQTVEVVARRRLDRSGPPADARVVDQDVEAGAADADAAGARARQEGALVAAVDAGDLPVAGEAVEGLAGASSTSPSTPSSARTGNARPPRAWMPATVASAALPSDP